MGMETREILADLLHQKRMTQQELATKSGISKVQVNRLLNGSRRLHYDQIIAFAKALEVSAAVLLGGVEPNPDAPTTVCVSFSVGEFRSVLKAAQREVRTPENWLKFLALREIQAKGAR